MFFIANAAGRAYSLEGWTSPTRGLHFRTAAEAHAECDGKAGFEGCTVKPVPAAVPPGMDPNGAAGIFGYRKPANG